MLEEILIMVLLLNLIVLNYRQQGKRNFYSILWFIMLVLQVFSILLRLLTI